MIEDRDKYVLIEVLAREFPGRMGRTALMKSMFFLQTLRNVPLGYRFTLYSYGPFDSDVLSDLGEAELLGYVQSEVVEYPGGYGYEIAPTDPPSELSRIHKWKKDIDWVIKEFGGMNSAELELASTVVYADREVRPASQMFGDLINRVGQVKPHFNEERIRNCVEGLSNKRLINSVAK